MLGGQLDREAERTLRFSLDPGGKTRSGAQLHGQEQDRFLHQGRVQKRLRRRFAADILDGGQGLKVPLYGGQHDEYGEGRFHRHRVETRHRLHHLGEVVQRQRGLVRRANAGLHREVERGQQRRGRFWAIRERLEDPNRRRSIRGRLRREHGLRHHPHLGHSVGRRLGLDSSLPGHHGLLLHPEVGRGAAKFQAKQAEAQRKSVVEEERKFPHSAAERNRRLRQRNEGFEQPHDDHDERFFGLKRPRSHSDPSQDRLVHCHFIKSRYVATGAVEPA